MANCTLAVCIATTGRPTILTETLRNVAAQTRKPDLVVVCPAKTDDVDPEGLAFLGFEVRVVAGRAGLAAQRNTLLRAADTADVILFIDDDFLLAPRYVEELTRLLEAESNCVVATGCVLADGAQGAGYSVEEGRAVIAALGRTGTRVAPVFNAYGCNMAIRWSALRGRGCWFDERLPLYAWAEDVDFSRQAAVFGTVLKADAMAGVHLASKQGRVSGVRFGYSQIANQVYLARKGSITVLGGSRKAAENIFANLVGTLRNDQPHVDRRGRLIGNVRGILDIMTGRVSPLRILDL